MPSPSAYGMLTHLMKQVKHDREEEIKRAIGFRASDPRKSAYHLGLADGRNGIIGSLTTILNSASIMKGDKANGR